MKTMIFYGFALINIIFLISCQNSRQKKVDELAREISKRIYENDDPIKYDNLHDEKCRSERDFIINQVKRIDNTVNNLEENYQNLPSQAFEKYLTQWNKEIEIIRNDIENYNYQCFKYSGIKGLGTLASQLGLDYIHIVMYNDKSDAVQTKSKFESQKRNIIQSLEASL